MPNIHNSQSIIKDFPKKHHNQGQLHPLRSPTAIRYRRGTTSGSYSKGTQFKQKKMKINNLFMWFFLVLIQFSFSYVDKCQRAQNDLTVIPKIEKIPDNPLLALNKQRDQLVNIELVRMLSTKRKIYAALSSCPETPKQIRNQLTKNATIPVYIPIPVFKFFETPVIQHYPINQVIEQAVPIVQKVMVEQTIRVMTPIKVPSIQKLYVPQPVPIPQLVNITIDGPIYNETLVEEATTRVNRLFSNKSQWEMMDMIKNVMNNNITIPENEETLRPMQRTKNLIQVFLVKQFINGTKTPFAVQDPSNDVASTLEQLWRFKQKFNKQPNQEEQTDLKELISEDQIKHNITANVSDKIVNFTQTIIQKNNKTNQLLYDEFEIDLNKNIKNMQQNNIRNLQANNFLAIN